MSKLFVFVFFFFLVAVNQFAAASNLPSQLTCNVTWTSDGSFTYTLIPAPTVTEHSSPSWANGTGHVFVVDSNFSTELVRNITEDSVTLKRCEEDIFFMHNRATPQEARCHVNCSLYATLLLSLLLPPSANHTVVNSSHPDTPPPSANHIWAVLVLVPVLVLILFLVWRKRKGYRCRGRSSEEEPETYVPVKTSDPAGGSEVMEG